MNRKPYMYRLYKKFKSSFSCEVLLTWEGNVCYLAVRYSDMSGTTWDTKCNNLTDEEILYCYHIGIKNA